MSACISGKGEFSEHTTTEGNFICDDCGVLDEDGILAELDALRSKVGRLRAGVGRVAQDLIDQSARTHHLPSRSAFLALSRRLDVALIESEGDQTASEWVAAMGGGSA